MDFYSALGGVIFLGLGMASRKKAQHQAAKKIAGGLPTLAMGIATGSFAFMLGKGVGLPLEMVRIGCSPSTCNMP